jgi:hypothetical protein
VTAGRKPPRGYTPADLAAIAEAAGVAVDRLDVGALDLFAARYREALRSREIANVTAVAANRKRIELARSHLLKALTHLGYDVQREDVGEAMRRLLSAAGDDELPTKLAGFVEMFDSALEILDRPDDPVRTAVCGFAHDAALDVLVMEGTALYKRLTGARPGFSVAQDGEVSGPFLRFLLALARPCVLPEGDVPTGSALRKRWRDLKYEMNMACGKRK